VNILMYHSVGKGQGPLAIDVDTFRMQLDALAQAGLRAAALQDIDQPGVAVLTFDDGYRDFAEVAWPEIEKRGWSATVFLSSGLMGTGSILDWQTVRRLADRGVELGSHAVTHRDLTRIAHNEAQQEIARSRETIEDETGATVTSFAAPFGHTTAAIRREIAGVYQRAVGTKLGRADAGSDRVDLPRIEMWYFRDPVRWRRHLEGASGYLTVRRTLRCARQLVGRGTGL
jgi:peptidoglycan/xylan/chitin deacetylase (PgdA/CDA1 family)